MPGIGAPSDSSSASPRAALSVASVGMNACGIRPFTSMIPLSAPTAMPVTSIIGITSAPPMSPQPYASAPVTVHSASSEPTDRSIPPTRITNSWPIARHASGATWTATLERLSPVRKNGDAMLMMTSRAIRISAGPSRITLSARFSACSEPALVRPIAGAAVLNADLPRCRTTSAGDARTRCYERAIRAGALVEVAARAEVELLDRRGLRVGVGHVARVLRDPVERSRPRTPPARAGRRARSARAGSRASRRGAGRRRRRDRSARARAPAAPSPRPGRSSASQASTSMSGGGVGAST